MPLLLFSSTTSLSDRVISSLNMYIEQADGLALCYVSSRTALPHSAVGISDRLAALINRNLQGKHYKGIFLNVFVF